jgi:hypothetical protein
MLLKDVVKAPKSGVKVSAWTQDKPQRKVFPLSCKAGGCFPLTRKWRWAVVEFDAIGSHFRVMVAYHVDLPVFQMVLGEALTNDTKVLARVEYDISHSPYGWHVHSNCEDSSQVSAGIIKPLGQRRIPTAGARHRRKEYSLSGESMNDIIALEVASHWFRFGYQQSLSLG